MSNPRNESSHLQAVTDEYIDQVRLLQQKPGCLASLKCLGNLAVAAFELPINLATDYRLRKIMDQ